MLLLLSLLFSLPSSVHGHGYMYQPVSRNWYTHTDGLSWGSSDGLPFAEYCPHCLNRNRGVCGVSETDVDYDDWRDSNGNAMPFLQLETYQRGDVIDVLTHLTAHHGGHMELRGCPDGAASTQACFDAHVFEFVEDSTNYRMPKDPAHPERGYYGGGASLGNGQDFAMKFKIPDNLVGEEVLLQWLYVTANSCLPDGYTEYFNGANEFGQQLDASYWGAGLVPCKAWGAQFMPLAPEGTGSGAFEQFVNCAEVSIVDGSGPNPTDPPVPPPTNAPATPSPIATSLRPTVAPTVSVVPPPTQAPVTSKPSNRPTTPVPTKLPTPVPPSTTTDAPVGGSFCCSHNMRDCNAAEWCSLSQGNCEGSCDATWIAQGCQGAAVYEQCNRDADCCGPATTCQGNEWYKQCQK